MTRPEPAAVLHVSVVHLRPGHAFEVRLRLPAPATVADAIAASGVLAAVPELARQPLRLGVFSRRRSMADPLHDGDRVEVYRPLSIDPKEARRLRAVVVRRRRRLGAARVAG